MKANFRGLRGTVIPDEELDAHADWLLKNSFGRGSCLVVSEREAPDGYEDYHCVDVTGEEFVWMNESFPREKYTWYLWFESVFLVPDEMVAFLKLRWT